MSQNPVIWILEDEPSSLTVYHETLDALYYTVYFSQLYQFDKALNNLDQLANEDKTKVVKNPDLIIVDIELEDGFFTDYIQEKGESILPCPHIVISIYDYIDLFRWCAGMKSLDFLVKPFSKDELIFKIERIFKDHFANQVLNYIQHHNIELTMKENQILQLLLSKDKAITRDEIIKKVWKGAQIHKNNVNTQISNIKKKIKNSPYKIDYLGDQKWEFNRG